MNERFFNLPDEKQKSIVNAACKGFFRYGYKKASMGEIAQEAGISKALLFHYFRNKKEFYLYLFSFALDLTMCVAREEISTTETDFFEIFTQSARVKSRLLKQHSYISRFMMSAYYEENEEVVSELKIKTGSLTTASIESILSRMDKNKLMDDINPEELVKIVIWSGEGYMKEKYYDEKQDVDEILTGYTRMLDFFKQTCYKQQYRKSQG